MAIIDKKGQKERLKKFIDFLGISPHRFNVTCGLSNSYTAAMKKGIGDDALTKIATTYSFLNTDWLISGEGEMIIDGVNNIYTERFERTRKVINKPCSEENGLYVYSLKGNGLFTETPARRVSMPEAEDGDLCITVTDDAMSPKYVPSSIIHIREVKDWKDYLGYGYDFVFILQDGRRIFRRAEKAENEKNILCYSYNNHYKEEHLPKNLINKVYRVIACLSFY